MYENQMDPAFAGMKADSGFDRVESFPAGTAGLDFGVATGTDANGLLVPGTGTKIRGVSVHSHAAGIVGGRYAPTECVSTMTRGLVWGKATGTVTKDAVAKYDPATGIFSDAGSATIPNSIFRSGATAVAGGSIVLVELHAPFAA